MVRQKVETMNIRMTMDIPTTRTHEREMEDGVYMDKVIRTEKKSALRWRRTRRSRKYGR